MLHIVWRNDNTRALMAPLVAAINELLEPGAKLPVGVTVAVIETELQALAKVLEFENDREQRYIEQARLLREEWEDADYECSEWSKAVAIIAQKAGATFYPRDWDASCDAITERMDGRE